LTAKTNTTAVVIIPPQECCEPIQAIRTRYDRQVRRWMPHITLIYPFRPRDDFEGLTDVFKEASSAIPPFEIKLAAFKYFRHGHGGFTLWLEPEPGEPLAALHDALRNVVPDCDDVRRFAGGFKPHLSVGQATSREHTLKLIESLHASWLPISFEVREISLIWRGEPPDDVFRVDRTIALGQQRQPMP
jgi:2'-5' RNA ligase